MGGDLRVQLLLRLRYSCFPFLLSLFPSVSLASLFARFLQYVDVCYIMFHIVVEKRTCPFLLPFRKTAWSPNSLNICASSNGCLDNLIDRCAFSHHDHVERASSAKLQWSLDHCSRRPDSLVPSTSTNQRTATLHQWIGKNDFQASEGKWYWAYTEGPYGRLFSTSCAGSAQASANII